MPPEAVLAAVSARTHMTAGWMVITVVTHDHADTPASPEIRFRTQPQTNLDTVNKLAWGYDAKGIAQEYADRQRILKGVVHARVFVCETGDSPRHDPLCINAVDVGARYLVGHGAPAKASARLLAIAGEAGRSR